MSERKCNKKSQLEGFSQLESLVSEVEYETCREKMKRYEQYNRVVESGDNEK